MTQLKRFLYGGDYNPDQWPEDIKVFKKADLNSATINVFSWSLLESREGQYDLYLLLLLLRCQLGCLKNILM